MKKPEQDASMQYVRLRTAAVDKKKALDHYQTLRRSGKSTKAVVISEDADGQITVLGQMLTPHAVAQLLIYASKGVASLLEEQQKPRLDPNHQPEKPEHHNQSKPRTPEITWGDDGVMIPPKGEDLIVCGECGYAKWYLLHHINTDMTARYACAHCGNEVKIIPLYHQEGTA
jgi:hypothetical protein